MNHLRPAHIHRVRGFTLIEVLVALGIVAVAMMAGVQATSALTRHAQRQEDVLLAKICAENALTRIKLSRQIPPTGVSSERCEQAGRTLMVTLTISATQDTRFRRVTAQALSGDTPVLQLSTLAGNF